MQDIEATVMRKLHVRIIYFSLLLFILNYLDRVNVSFAALQMNRDVGLTATAYGFGAGIFALGYVLFELPSNLIMLRVGARIWIARIMVTWGIVACAMALVEGPLSFYLLRFLLGVAEAGLLPGIILYLTFWFPEAYRARAASGFMMAVALSLVIGGPLSTYLMTAFDGVWGYAGWKWMFVLEGLPTVAVGVFTYFYLVDRPEDGRWLNAQEQAWLTNRLRVEREAAARTSTDKFGDIFKQYSFYALCLIYTLNAFAILGVILWLPQIVKRMSDFSTMQVGLVSTVPYIFATLGMMLAGRSSDRMNERQFHVVVCCGGGGLALAASALVSSPLVGFMLLCVAAMGIWGMLGIFWTLPMKLFGGAAAAGAIAVVNMSSGAGGFGGPYLVGWLRDLTGGFTIPLLVLASGPVLAALFALTLPRERLQTSATSGAIA